MNKMIKVLSGNPGVGKTQQFIETIETGKRYVYVAPTRVLALEVMERLDAIGKAYLPIFTGLTKEGQVGQVIRRTGEALTDKKASILIITHKCLASIDPMLVTGWELVIDEAPKVEEIENVSVIESEWERVMAPFIGDCDENGYLIINDAMAVDAWEIYAQGLEDARNQRRRRNSTLLMLLEGMFCATKHVTATPSRDNKGKPVVRISVEGFTDFTRAFNYASSVTLMGANVEKSLLVTHARKKGFTLDIDKQRQHNLALPYIFPLIRDNPGAYISKRQLMTMPDGSVAKEWNSQCFGQLALDRALAYIGDAPAIFAGYAWCTPTLPENVERIPIDCRGLNQWRDRSVSIHLIHGNPSPEEFGPTKRILGEMGVDLEEGREAIRWHREEDLVTQHAFRTSLRVRDSEVDTIHIVASLTQAHKLSDALGGARIISDALMVDPPMLKPTEAKTGREARDTELKAQVLAMASKGLTQRDIANELKLSQSKVKRLVNS